jgi:hypothetical protein
VTLDHGKDEATAQSVPVQIADPALTVTVSPAALSGASR